MNAEDLQAIRERAEKANAEMDRLTAGSPGANWRWSIPANPERDTDLILAASTADVPRLLAEVERLQRADALMLDSARSTPSGFDIQMHAGGPQTQEALIFIADAMRSQLDEYEATNYLEMQLRASDGKNYVMTLQRQGGAITPHEARQAAEARLDKVRALHKKVACTDEDGEPIPGDFYACLECKDLDDHSGERVHEVWPCPTIQALGGSDQ